MIGVALVYSLFGSAEAAERIARTVLEERLAACVNILPPCTSLYEWDGALQRVVEIPALFKTAPDRRDALMTRIAALHDYDVPAVLALAADAVDGFAAWVGTQSR